MNVECLGADLRTTIASHMFKRDWTTYPIVDSRLSNQVDIMGSGKEGIYASPIIVHKQ